MFFITGQITKPCSWSWQLQPMKMRVLSSASNYERSRTFRLPHISREDTLQLFHLESPVCTGRIEAHFVPGTSIKMRV
jgi:hypothetical protein